MSRKSSVLLFGDINVDNIFLLSEFPDPGRDGFANHVEMHLGGVVCNSAAVLEGLGQPTKLLAAVGDDMWSKFVDDELRKAQIDSQYVVKKSDLQTGLIFIAVTPNGERTMFCHRGANIAYRPGDIPEDVLDGVCLVAMTGYVFLEAPQCDTAWKLIDLAAKRHIPISMDTGLDPVILAPNAIKDVLPYLSLLITGEAEAERLTNATTHQGQRDAFIACGLKQVAVKLGRRGAWLGWAGGLQTSPAFQVQVVDTTSAGDAFTAGLVYGYVHGLSPSGSLLLANALGGLATTVYGAARIGGDDILSFLEERHQHVDVDDDREVFTEVIQGLSTSV